MRFKTGRDIDRLKPPEGKADSFVFDEERTGLSVRFQIRVKSWVIHYQLVSGKRRRITLDDLGVSGETLAEARDRARAIRRQAKLGGDPIDEREKAAADAAALRADTVGRLIELYLAGYAERQQRENTLAETRRLLLRIWQPLHSRPLSAVDRRDVAPLLLQIAAERGGVTGNRARSALSAVFAWGIKQGIVDRNPVAGTMAPHEEKARERTLTGAELAEVWRASEGFGEFGRIVRLLALTVQRRGEVAGMTRRELDIEAATWSLPGTRTKNGRPHVVPLSRQALAQFGGEKGGASDALLFRAGRKGFSGWAWAKGKLDEAIQANRGEGAEPMPTFVLHDIRRTGVTGMAEIGIPPHIVEAVVNHVSGHKGGVAGIYNKAVYANEKRAALQRWADHVDELLGRGGGANVVPFRA